MYELGLNYFKMYITYVKMIVNIQKNAKKYHRQKENKYGLRNYSKLRLNHLSLALHILINFL